MNRLQNPIENKEKIERLYTDELVIQSNLYLRIIFAIGLTILTGFTLKDIILYSAVIFYNNYAVYLFFLSVTVAGFVSTFFPDLRKYSSSVLFFSILSSAFSLLYLLASAPQSCPYAYMSVILLLVFMAFVPVISIAAIVVCGPALIALYTYIASTIAHIPPSNYLQHLFYMITVQIVIIVSRSIYESLLREFILQAHQPRRYEIKVFSSFYGLSGREKNLIPLILDGLQTPKIAETAEISTETAKKHIRNIYKKTGVHSRIELFALFDSFFQVNDND